MKLVKTLTKIMVALAAVAGAVYVIATYGDKIVAWAKKVLASLPCCCGECCCEECECEECECEEYAEEAAEEAVEEAEEVAAEEPAAEEAVAEEADFA